jgi:hypothetical protein
MEVDMESIMLTQWQRLALETGLRKLAASGEIERESLAELQKIIANSIQIRAAFKLP